MADAPFQSTPVPGGRRITFDVRAERILGHEKHATFGKFTMISDEASASGGDPAGPAPLGYFAAALAI